MAITPQGLALIKRYEGFSALPYRCPAGYITVGYGHVVLPHEVFDMPLSEAQADKLLVDDVMLAERAVRRFIERALHAHEYDALVSFTFNLGAAALQRSRLRRAVVHGSLDEVETQWMRWVYAKGRRLSGLVARRRAEFMLYAGHDFH